MSDELKYICTPQEIENDCEYCEKLSLSFKKYIDYINNNSNFNTIESEVKEEAENNCESILKSLELYFEGRIQEATLRINDILKNFMDSKFIVSELDDSYAFRMIGKINELHDENVNYDHLNTANLTFFRARVSDEPLNRSKISHIPVRKRERASTERFCIAGIPCLYLCVSTFSCWKEIGSPVDSKFYCSAVRFNDEGKKLKILNLAVSINLILGLGDTDETRGYIKDFIRFYPLVLATSFSIKQENRMFKSEYIISQLIMHCLKALGIDGVAYRSTKFKGIINFPLDANLALPVFDEDTFDDKYELTEPELLESAINLIDREDISKRSFINKYYEKKSMGLLSQSESDVKCFQSSKYHDFDDYLINKEYKKLKDE